MTVRIYGTAKLSLSHGGGWHLTVSGIESSLNTLFIGLGVKRSSGAPATCGAFDVAYNAGTLLSYDQGKFRADLSFDQAWLQATHNYATLPFGDALAGDHLWLFATHLADPPVDNDTTLDHVLEVGTVIA